MKTKSFRELRKRMTPEPRAKNETITQFALLYLTVVELQKSLGMSNGYSRD
jgi:hypothetical protein